MLIPVIALLSDSPISDLATAATLPSRRLSVRVRDLEVTWAAFEN